MFGIKIGRRRVCECAVCGELFHGKAERLCSHCAEQLTYTHFWRQPSSPVREAVEALHATQWVIPLCYYGETGNVRLLVRKMKYHGRLDVAFALGLLYAHTLQEAGVPIAFDAVVPVPLHWRKLVRRGYNQCTSFAKGIASQWGIPVLPALRRCKHSKSQTQCASPAARHGNVQGAFAPNARCLPPPGTHVLLVDDVLTTGATMGECVAMLRAQGLTCAVGSFAVAPGLCKGRLDATASTHLDNSLFPLV